MEIVDQEIEKVLPAFRAAVHCELLTEAEVKQIVLARKKDEARLIKRECELTDYINFLHRDTMVLKLIGKRREKSQYRNKLDEIEYKLVGRLTRLMKRAQRLWPENMTVWATHIALCEKWNKRTQLSKLYEEMISRFPHNVNVWISAAKFQLERNGSVDQARKLLLRAQQQVPTAAEIYDQLFRIELVNSAQIVKRLNVAGGSADSSELEPIETDVRQGAAAIGVFVFILKNYPDNYSLLFNMVVQAKSLEPQIKNVTDELTKAFMELKSVDVIQYQAEYLRKYTPGGTEAAITLYKSAVQQHPHEVEMMFQLVKFIDTHQKDHVAVTELLKNILASMAAVQTPVPTPLLNGEFVRYLVSSKMENKACEIQRKIVNDNDLNERERFILLELMIRVEIADAEIKENFEILFKSDNEAINQKSIELCSDWCGESEGRLLWFASKKAAGKCHLVVLRDGQSRKMAVQTLLQQSATNPINIDFLHLGIELMEGEYEADQLRFVDKCCLMESTATMWMELLKLYSNKHLSELGSIFLRAKSHLSPTEFELLNQRWQLNKTD